MYRAKQDGRNQYCVYQPSEGWQTDLQVQARLGDTHRAGAAQRRFRGARAARARPQSGAVDRYELLLRMEDPDGALILPGVFLPVAERTGQIAEIDRWMVRRAIDLISMTSSPEEPCRLDVNLSGVAFSDQALLTLIESELIRTGSRSVAAWHRDHRDGGGRRHGQGARVHRDAQAPGLPRRARRLRLRLLVLLLPAEPAHRLPQDRRCVRAEHLQQPTGPACRASDHRAVRRVRHRVDRRVHRGRRDTRHGCATTE